MLFGVRKKDTGVPGDIWLYLENQQQLKNLFGGLS